MILFSIRLDSDYVYARKCNRKDLVPHANNLINDSTTHDKLQENVSFHLTFFSQLIFYLDFSFMQRPYTENNSSSNFTELFHESRIQAIREQSAEQFSNLLADHTEQFRNTLKSSVIFKVKVVVKGFSNYLSQKKFMKEW